MSFWREEANTNDLSGVSKKTSFYSVVGAVPFYNQGSRAEVDMPLHRFRRQYEQMSQFGKGRIIGMIEAGWSARRVARQIDRSDCVVRRCWDQ
ncbi:transposable element Tcb2 transposase [Trichonephila clavipes]|nr:transposable element Tcb2 transposase [Trichonephila clavipes]